MTVHELLGLACGRAYGVVRRVRCYVRLAPCGCYRQRAADCFRSAQRRRRVGTGFRGRYLAPCNSAQSEALIQPWRSPIPVRCIVPLPGSSTRSSSVPPAASTNRRRVDR